MAEYGVGGAFRTRRPRLEKSEINPGDKCTIVSIYHASYTIDKLTTQPSSFTINGCPQGEPFALTVVGPASWWREDFATKQFIEVSCNSLQIATALVNDFVTTKLGYKGAVSRPGIFVMIGEWAPDTIVIAKDKSGKTFAQCLDAARAAQKTYYNEIVQMADSLWARTNGNPLSISGEQRIAALKLNLNNKPWLQDAKIQEQINCIACGTLVLPQYPICPNCKAILNVEEAKKLNIKFAQVG